MKLSIVLFALLGFSYSVIAQELHPGDIAPNVVKVDVDEFVMLTHGVCIVKKGTKQAVIDLKGNFVVPWGKFVFGSDYSTTKLHYGGLIPAQSVETFKYGCIDPQGNVVVPFVFTNSLTFTHFLVAAAGTDAHYNNVSINEKGEKVKINSVSIQALEPQTREPFSEKQDMNHILQWEMQEVEEPLQNGAYPQRSGQAGVNKKGQRVFKSKKVVFYYCNKAGRVTLRPDFEICREFTEGLAAVKKTDQFGVSKWGFIDTLGRLVIQPTFQNEPGYFHGGLALVMPVEKTDFSYAYIDPTGEIKLKLGDGANKYHYQPVVYGSCSADYRKSNRNDGQPVLPCASYFVKGWALWLKDGQSVLLNTAGEASTLTMLANNPSLAKDETGLAIHTMDEKGIFMFSSTYLSKRNNLGLLGYDGAVLFPPSFDQLFIDYFSPYAIATVVPDLTNNDKKATNKHGIVNKDGVFIMVKAEAKTW